jgi:hypothetical protein
MDPIEEFQAQSAELASQLAALRDAAVHQRWTVKIAADDYAQALVSQPPTETTIASLVALPVPATPSGDGRSDGAEKTKFQVSATLAGYKLESDGDYHLVIKDAQDRSMIAEIPNPANFTTPSHFADQIAATRTAFDNHFGLTETALKAPAPADALTANPLAALVPAPLMPVSVGVTIVGLGFFDFSHGQTGVAPNAIEIHPVVAIQFTG